MTNKNINNTPFKSISRRLILYIVLCSSLLTLVLTILQLQRDYQTDIAEQDKGFEQIRQVHLKTISEGLWATDTELLQTIIEGLIYIHDVNYAAIIENGEILLSIGDKPAEDTRSRTFPLSYEYLGNINNIGTLEVAIDVDAAYGRVLDRALIILISNAFKTALVVVFTLVIFHLMVTRHLTNITDYLTDLYLARDFKPLKLLHREKNPNSRDELDLVVNSINDSSMRITQAFAMEQEIKEQEYAEAALRKSEARLLQILDHSPFGVSIISLADKKRLYVNRRYIDMIGIPENEPYIEDLVAKSYINPAEREELWTIFKRDGVINAIEQQRIHLDGSIWWAYSDWRPYKFMGEYAVMIWLSDITERKQAETKLQQLNDQKNKFFSIIAHDLKGPFNSLLGFSSLLSRQGNGMDPEKMAEYGCAVHKSGQQVFKLLENLLDWSLLQMDRMEVELGPVDVEKSINENVDLFTPVSDEKNIRLSVACEKSLTVFADKYMFDTIIRNLIHNAIKFTQLNGDVTISSRNMDNWAEIKVSDTGVGIPAAKAKRLFRLDEKSTLGTNGETGTGLGLPLCKDMVERQGGQIKVESIKGKGSTFRITLPLNGTDTSANKSA